MPGFKYMCLLFEILFQKPPKADSTHSKTPKQVDNWGQGGSRGKKEGSKQQKQANKLGKPPG